MNTTSTKLSENASDLIDKFHADCKLRGFVSSMEYVYGSRAFCTFLEARGKTPVSAAKDDIKEFLTHLREKGNKVSSIDRTFTCLTAFYDYLIEEELTENNIIRPFRKRYLRKYKSENEAEIRKLISVEDASRLVNSVLDTRDRCILVLLFKTGMRVGELISLDVDDVDLARGEITLKHTKKRSNRVLYLDNEAIAALERWLVSRKERPGSEGSTLFISKKGKRMTKLTIENITKKHAARIGLHNPASKKLEERFTPHCARHWFVTHLLRAGMPRDFVKELRGDVRREAIDVYNHIDKEELKESFLAHIPQLGI
jgi:integrase/recombinase XerD